jgi:hypothetical protein
MSYKLIDCLSLQQKSGKSNARKGFLRGVVTTEQHDKQKSLLNTVRTHTRTRSESGQQAIDAPVVQTRVYSKKSSNDMNQLNASTDRARKTFAMPLPPNTSAVADKTSTTTPSEPNLSQDESSTHSTPGTPSKRKKRYYKGGTYGLYLSKKRRKLKEQKKANEKIDSSVKSSGVGAEGEESSQSFAANSESDGELDGESSDMSNADDERDVEDIANEINESNDDLLEEFVDAVEGSGEQPVLINEDVSKNGIPEDASDNIGSQSHTMPPKEANPCNVGDHVKRRPGRGRRRVDGLSEEDYQSPPSSTNSKSNASKESRQLSPNKDSSGHKGETSESTPGLTNGTTRQVFQLAANNVTSSVVQNPNRKTLLRISTAGSVMSGDTTGTQLGAELSKFVLVVSCGHLYLFSESMIN